MFIYKIHTKRLFPIPYFLSSHTSYLPAPDISDVKIKYAAPYYQIFVNKILINITKVIEKTNFGDRNTYDLLYFSV